MTGALAELERLALFGAITSGRLPPNATRPLMPWEVRAKVDFAGIDRTLQEGYTAATDVINELGRAVTNDLRLALAGAPSARAVGNIVTTWASTQSYGVRQAALTATTDMLKVLHTTATKAGAAVIREAHAQGVKAPLLPVQVSSHRLAGPSKAAPTATVARIQSAALGLGPLPDIEAATAAAEGVSLAGVIDLARQAVNLANGDGRAEQAQSPNMPDPQEIYSSELLDGNTCDPCGSVDGTRYDTLDDAMSDYPDSGPYVGCDGGARCRGTLVIVWGETTPGDQPTD